MNNINEYGFNDQLVDKAFDEWKSAESPTTQEQELVDSYWFLEVYY